jgi:hypothetical protein
VIGESVPCAVLEQILCSSGTWPVRATETVSV